MIDVIYVAVLDFNLCSVSLYEIEKQEALDIADDLDIEFEIDTLDEIVCEYMHSNRGHRASECQYMFSTEPIPLHIK
jgi:hypothetical protein